MCLRSLFDLDLVRQRAFERDRREFLTLLGGAAGARPVRMIVGFAAGVRSSRPFGRPAAVQPRGQGELRRWGLRAVRRPASSMSSMFNATSSDRRNAPAKPINSNARSRRPFRVAPVFAAMASNRSAVAGTFLILAVNRFDSARPRAAAWSLTIYIKHSCGPRTDAWR